MDLPPISFEHLKNMTAFSVEELLNDRLLLAQKIAYTFKAKKKIPATTSEFYKVRLSPELVNYSS
jgi:hypothetical protein